MALTAKGMASAGCQCERCQRARVLHRAACRRDYARRRAAVRDKQRRYQSEHREYWRLYYQENTEALKRSAKEWAKNNPDRRRDIRNRRRARKAGNDSNGRQFMPRGYMQKLTTRQRNKCTYCSVEMTLPWNASVPTSRTIDHVVPISKGGAHSWDNVVLACHQCNARKRSKSAAEFLEVLNGRPA